VQKSIEEMYMMLQPDELEKFLHAHIPITSQMQISVDEIDAQRVRMRAKLKPNENDKHIAFAGSIQSLLTICSWGMVFSLLYNIDKEVQLFIRRNSIEYTKPVDNDFTAECSIEDTHEREQFITTYRQKHKSRLTVRATLYNRHEAAAHFQGEFVAIQKIS
jgi:thioesterase domain-containing protein